MALCRSGTGFAARLTTLYLKAKRKNVLVQEVEALVADMIRFEK